MVCGKAKKNAMPLSQQHWDLFPTDFYVEAKPLQGGV
jgi:hypothetical protein